MANEDKVNILVVDDLPEKLLVIGTILEGLGQNVVTARSGREALRRLLEQEFAVILLDVNMPDINGFETAAMIRSRRQTEHTPIIFVTAFGDEIHTAQGYSLGAVDYILSPVVPEILRTKVGVFVDLYRKTQQVERQAEERVALAREQAARAAAEDATRRSNFLAEASTVLARSLDYDATLRGLARQVVPFLGDLGSVTLIDERGGAPRTELAWAESAGGPVALRSLEGGVPHPALADAIDRVTASGEPEYLPALARETPGGGAGPGPAFPLHAAAVIPLQARGRTLGTLTLAMGPSGRRYAPADLALARDLADRAAIAIDNARLYRDIQEGDRRKNEFLAMLAHELRNPLAPIRNAVQVLRMIDLRDTDLLWANDVIARQVEQMVRLVDDLLDISRITGGKIQLQREPVDVAAVVARAVETSRPLIDARRHELTVELPEETLAVDADRVRLAQVLANVLNNAAKYTGDGGRIWLTAARDGPEAVFRVRDTGIGISKEMLSSVFDLFTQVNHSLDRSQGGLGIGLTLVRRLVEMHGGNVQAFSDGVNQGSEFVIRMPALTGPHPPGPSTNGDRAASGASAPRRVLVVDDNDDAARSLARLLRLTGHEVTTAPDGASALAALPAFGPEIVLLDIGLPGMDGYEVAREMRRHPGGEKLALVALTGYGQDEDRRRSQEAGFNEHLVKPVDPDVLQSLLASLSDRPGPAPVLAPM
jgi:signal transduction histidine kinase/DNA-binding response OmpR family regulator